MFTNADQDAVIQKAATLNIDITSYDASVFLGAQELLEADPSNIHAAKAIANFNAWMATGTKPHGFDEFMLPDFYTVEELEAQNKRRDEHIAYCQDKSN